MTLNRPLAVFAALNGAMAVALGAFAAHGAGPAVKTLLTTGAHYQIVHAVLALVSVTAAWFAFRWAGSAPAGSVSDPSVGPGAIAAS